MAETIKIGGELESVATGGIVTRANRVLDATKGKTQDQVNQETDAAIQAETERATAAENNRYTKSETYNKAELNNMVTTPEVNYVNVEATDQTTAITDVLPATGAADTIYKIGNWDGSQYDTSKYSEYTWNGSAYVDLATRDHGVDDKPTAGSNNLVKSGGIRLDTDKYKMLNEGSLIETVVGTDGAYTDYNLSNPLEAGFYIIEANISSATTVRFKTSDGTIIAQKSINYVGQNAFPLFISGTVTTIRFSGLGSTFKIYSTSDIIRNLLDYDKLSFGVNSIFTKTISDNPYADYDCNLEAGVYVMDASSVGRDGNTVSIRFKDANGDFITTSPTPLELPNNSRKILIFSLPSNAKKIRLGGYLYKYTLYKTQGVLSVVLPDVYNNFANINSQIKILPEILTESDILIASVTGTDYGYTDYNCSIPAGIYKIVETVNSSIVRFKNQKGEIIATWSPDTDNYILIPEEATRIRFAYIGTKVDIYGTDGILPKMEAEIGKKADKVSATVIKTVGVGNGYDYSDIASALAAITDASENKRYEIRVCSDYKYTLPTQLYREDNATHPSSDTAPAYCAAFFTKNYINIVGWNRRRTIEVIMPDTVTKPENIVAMHLQGNCTVKNIDFTIKNGRYAIHQESGGSASSIDYHATTILEDSVVTHLGNDSAVAQYWSSTFAQANGACHGLHCVYKNITWIRGFYMHSNANFDAPVSVEFYNCRKNLPFSISNIDEGSSQCYIGNNGQGHNVRIHIEGSSLLSIYGRMNMMDGNTLDNPARDIRTQIPIFTGFGNAPSVLAAQVIETLSFETLANNKNVSVTGGTAKELIYGEDYKVYGGTSDAVGVCIGTEAIQLRSNNYNYSLAYRLGDCATTNKTLIVSVDGVDETITFAENFKTNFSIWNDAAIIEYINNQLTLCKAVLNSPYSKFSLPFDDCAEEGYNGGDTTILYGMPLLRRDSTNWIICPAGQTPNGIALERINPNKLGRIAYIDKSWFRDLNGLETTSQGTMVSVGENGTWVVDSSNPLLKARFDNVFKRIGL